MNYVMSEQIIGANYLCIRTGLNSRRDSIPMGELRSRSPTFQNDGVPDVIPQSARAIGAGEMRANASGPEVKVNTGIDNECVSPDARNAAPKADNVAASQNRTDSIIPEASRTGGSGAEALSPNSNSSAGGHVDVEHSDQRVQNGDVGPQQVPQVPTSSNRAGTGTSTRTFGLCSDAANATTRDIQCNIVSADSERPPPYSSSESAVPAAQTSPEHTNGKETSEAEEGVEFGGTVRAEVSDPPATKPIFSPLLILTAMTGSFAHGGNDVRFAAY